MKNAYLVQILEGLPREMTTHTVFVTLDAQKAKTWVSRFNSIVDANKERLTNVDLDKTTAPFLHDYIVYDDPIAQYKEVKLR